MLCYAKLSRIPPQNVQRPRCWTPSRPARAPANAFYEARDRKDDEAPIAFGDKDRGVPDAASAAGPRADASPERLLDDLRSLIADDPGSARVTALRLANLLAAPTAVDAVDERGGLAPWQRRKLDRHLRENLARPLRLKGLAALVNLSVSHFNRSFKESHGVAPHRYIIQLRLKLAQSLMQDTADSLCDIALACGLTDQAHLTKLFRQHIGQTPNAWRRSHVVDDPRSVTVGHEIADQMAGNGQRTYSQSRPRPVYEPEAIRPSHSLDRRRSWGGQNDADISAQ